jgi:hypothetical protein
MSTEESHQHLKAIDAQTTEQELVEIYKTWSETYDKVRKPSKEYIFYICQFLSSFILK